MASMDVPAGGAVGVHVGSLRNPAGEFPKAMFFACGLVLKTDDAIKD